MKHHELKIWPKYYDRVSARTKTFEVRKNDRDFQAGDIVTLREFDPLAEQFTGNMLAFKVGYVLPIENEMVVFSLLPIERQPDETI